MKKRDPVRSARDTAAHGEEGRNPSTPDPKLRQRGVQETLAAHGVRVWYVWQMGAGGQGGGGLDGVASLPRNGSSDSLVERLGLARNSPDLQVPPRLPGIELAKGSFFPEAQPPHIRLLSIRPQCVQFACPYKKTPTRSPIPPPTRARVHTGHVDASQLVELVTNSRHGDERGLVAQYLGCCCGGGRRSRLPLSHRAR